MSYPRLALAVRPLVHYTHLVDYGFSLGHLTPDEQVAFAMAPFVIALVLRILLGRTQFTRWVVMLSTMWFAASVLLAPYSTGLREQLIELENQLR